MEPTTVFAAVIIVIVVMLFWMKSASTESFAPRSYSAYLFVGSPCDSCPELVKFFEDNIMTNPVFDETKVFETDLAGALQYELVQSYGLRIATLPSLAVMSSHGAKQYNGEMEVKSALGKLSEFEPTTTVPDATLFVHDDAAGTKAAEIMAKHNKYFGRLDVWNLSDVKEDELAKLDQLYRRFRKKPSVFPELWVYGKDRPGRTYQGLLAIQHAVREGRF